MESWIFKSILEQVGIYFLKYILYYNKEISYETPFEKLQFDDQQILILNDLNDRLIEAAKWSVNNPHRGLTPYLYSLRVEERSMFNLYREKCGGQISYRKEGDAVVDFLIDKAREL